MSSHPKKLTYQDVKNRILKYNFYDEELNPYGAGINNEFSRVWIPTSEDSGYAVVIDLATELMWWWDGGINLDEEMRRKEFLNSNYGGYKDWRIPRISELLSLVASKVKDSDLGHVDTVFREEDYYDFTSANQVKGENEYWGVSLISGCVTRTGTEHICKPVRDMQSHDYQNPIFQDMNFNGYAQDFYNRKHNTTVDRIRIRF